MEKSTMGSFKKEILVISIASNLEDSVYILLSSFSKRPCIYVGAYMGIEFPNQVPLLDV